MMETKHYTYYGFARKIEDELYFNFEIVFPQQPCKDSFIFKIHADNQKELNEKIENRLINFLIMQIQYGFDILKPITYFDADRNCPWRIMEITRDNVFGIAVVI